MDSEHVNDKDIPNGKISEMGTPQQQQQQPPQPHPQQQQQQYCLRWNNHRTNLLSVFDELLQNEAFTDLTLACEGGTVRCHRMVLAACSQYFQVLLTDLPCKHPVVVLKDVRLEEMRAILEYMYKGEVNVAQDQLAGLLRVAESLKVKGLVEEKGGGGGGPHHAPPPPHSRVSPPEPEPMDHSHSPPSPLSPPPHISTSTPSAPSLSPPLYKAHTYAGYKGTTRPLPVWPPLPQPHCYDATDMSPLRRKKLSSLLMQHRDTPILRTVLGQGQQEAPLPPQHQQQQQPPPHASQQPVSLVCRPDSRESVNGSDYDKLHLKNEPSEDAQSPYTDFSEESGGGGGMGGGMGGGGGGKEVKLGVPSSSPQAFSGIATYVPAQKPEWKRYKQYTRNDIMSAIDAVRNGMSALQAARKYGVPSRTLYDKVKKLGITTSRPFKRGANGSSACFPYAPFADGDAADAASSPASAAFLEATTLLQHALDGAGDEKREALAAIAAAAAAAHAQHHHPPPSPRYHRSPDASPGHASDADDHVEDLSVQRHQVIVPNPEKVEAEVD